MFRSLIFCISISISIAVDITKQGEEEKIVGGKETTSTQIPFQISLSKRNKGLYSTTYNFICGGSIISESFILTAAHCTEKDPEPKNYRVRTGSSVTKQDGELHQVTRIIPHEDYKHDGGIRNDICLLQIYPPVSFDSKQQPVELAIDAGLLPAGYTVSVSGFGKPSENEPATERLKVADLPIIAWNKCYDFYRREKTIVTEDFICAGVKDNSLNSCQGDSGGPLFTKSKVLVGIVSWGVGCTKPLYPGAYTNVSFFKKWIMQKLAEAGEKAKFQSFKSSEPMNSGHQQTNNGHGQGHQSNGQAEWHNSKRPQVVSNNRKPNYNKPGLGSIPLLAQNLLGNLLLGHNHPSYNSDCQPSLCSPRSYPQNYYGSDYYSTPSFYGYSPYGSGYGSGYGNYYIPYSFYGLYYK